MRYLTGVLVPNLGKAIDGKRDMLADVSFVLFHFSRDLFLHYTVRNCRVDTAASRMLQKECPIILGMQQ